VTHFKAKVSLPDMSFMMKGEATPANLAAAANDGTPPGERKLADPRFQATVRALAADLEAGRTCTVGAATVWPVSKEEFDR
jgi:hypothetical protein